MNDLTKINTIFLIISLLVSGYFAGLVGMPLGPIRIFFMLFFGVNALIVFGTNLAISFVMMIPTVWNNLKNQRVYLEDKYWRNLGVNNFFNGLNN